MCFDPSHYGALHCGELSFNRQLPQRIMGNGAGASHLGTGTERRHVPAIGPGPPTVFLAGFVLLFRFSTVWLPMKAGDCNIWRGATPSSVKSSDCVTDFPVQGGIAADYIPLLPRMWFFGPTQYKHRELVGGSLVVRLPQARPRARFC